MDWEGSHAHYKGLETSLGDFFLWFKNAFSKRMHISCSGKLWHFKEVIKRKEYKGKATQWLQAKEHIFINVALFAEKNNAILIKQFLPAEDHKNINWTTFLTKISSYYLVSCSYSLIYVRFHSHCYESFPQELTVWDSTKMFLFILYYCLHPDAW